MARHKNINWSLPDRFFENWEQVHAAILMDIRDELQAINNKLGCYRVSGALDAIRIMHKTGVKIRKPAKRKKEGAAQ